MPINYRAMIMKNRDFGILEATCPKLFQSMYSTKLHDISPAIHITFSFQLHYHFSAAVDVIVIASVGEHLEGN